MAEPSKPVQAVQLNSVGDVCHDDVQGFVGVGDRFS
jgi:hypothetical protein